MDSVKLDVVAQAILDDDANFAVADLDVGGLDTRAGLDHQALVAIWKRLDNFEHLKIRKRQSSPQLDLFDKFNQVNRSFEELSHQVCFI